MSKETTIYARISAEMKAKLSAEAKRRDEAEAVVIREALREYLDKREGAEFRLNEQPIGYRDINPKKLKP